MYPIAPRRLLAKNVTEMSQKCHRNDLKSSEVLLFFSDFKFYAARE